MFVGLFVAFLTSLSAVHGGTIIATIEDRQKYLSQALAWFPDRESLISSRDLYNGPPNPYNLKTWQTLDCDFVEPSKDDPMGGTTPKFTCSALIDGKSVDLKIKYDQQYNSVHTWGRGNPEVYTSVISQRVLWALGFGGDQSVPVVINCKNCPIEPWTYVQAIQGYEEEDVLSGWLDVELLNNGLWKTKVSQVQFASSIVYVKLNKYQSGDEIDYLDAEGVQQRGFDWHEMYLNQTSDSTQSVARDALSVVAAFLSYCDNFDGNQGFICLDGDDVSSSGVSSGVEVGKSQCKGTPLIYIHDVGGTLGYGWNLKHLNFWPNYMDLQQWLEVSTWGDLKKCEVYVNGIPGSSWSRNLPVSEEGRKLAARLLSQLTDAQITDLFTSARSNLMRNDSVTDWIDGFKSKLTRDILGVSCGRRS